MNNLQDVVFFFLYPLECKGKLNQKKEGPCTPGSIYLKDKDINAAYRKNLLYVCDCMFEFSRYFLLMLFNKYIYDWLGEKKTNQKLKILSNFFFSIPQIFF